MLRWMITFLATIALGLASRVYPAGWFLWDRVLGEILYAVAAYLAWVVILPRYSPVLVAGVAYFSCVAVELFKLTGIPANNQDQFLVRWFLGMTFSSVNLGYYFLGIVLIALADARTRGSRKLVAA